MRKSTKSWVEKGMMVCVLAGALSLAACSKHPSEEQLRALEATKKAALAAEDMLAQKRRERDNLQRQLEQKKADLQKAENEKQAVAARLAGQ
jgi:septal ring factor EnvC (AmiA/AmiB activator)